MFTGLIEALGTVTSISPSPTDPTSTLLQITPHEPSPSPSSSLLSTTSPGDSISINGTCLTVTTLSSPSLTSFTVLLAPETLRRTNLSSLTADPSLPSSLVNLERASLPTTRLGGHFVEGHVDTTARILSVTPDGDARVFRLRPRDEAVMRYVVEKGYVALDGASLTVTAVRDVYDGGGGAGEEEKERGPWWEVMLIPYTQEKIVTARKEVGEEVNVEIDIVGKYVEKSVVGYLEGRMGAAAGVPGGVPQILEKMVGRIVEEKLKLVGR